MYAAVPHFNCVTSISFIAADGLKDVPGLGGMAALAGVFQCAEIADQHHFSPRPGNGHVDAVQFV